MISRPSARRRLVLITEETLSPVKIIQPLGTRDAESPRPLGPGALVRCSPEGIRTLATAVRGRRPGPLDDGAGRVDSATAETAAPPGAGSLEREDPPTGGSGALLRVAPKGFEPSLPP